MSELEIRHADPREGFDHSEPNAKVIVAFAIGSAILLIMTIMALQSYFNHIWEKAVYDKILAPPSNMLVQLHQREDWNLTHYGYLDKKAGVVRIPLDRAMELFSKEAAAGKLFYPAKDEAPPKDDTAPAAPSGAPAPAK